LILFKVSKSIAFTLLIWIPSSPGIESKFSSIASQQNFFLVILASAVWENGREQTWMAAGKRALAQAFYGSNNDIDLKSLGLEAKEASGGSGILK
jgi:hypothetical protein